MEVPSDEKNLSSEQSEIFRKLKLVENDTSSTNRLIMRCLNNERISNRDYVLYGITWNIMLPLWYNYTERLILYLHLMPFSGGNGLKYGAQHYFSKSINELTQDELLRLIAISRSPTNFSREIEKPTVDKIVEEFRKQLE